MKICSRCRLKQPLTNFNKKTGKRLSSACKQCLITIRRTSYLEHRPAVIRKTKLHKQNNLTAANASWVLKLLRLMQHNYKHKPIPDITLKQLQRLATVLSKRLHKNPYCPYTQVKLVSGKNLSLDHKKPLSRYPELAFTASNLQWTSKTYNSAKHNLTDSEFRKLCRQILDDR